MLRSRTNSSDHGFTPSSTLRAPVRLRQLAVKHALDVALACFAAIILSPLFVVIALAIVISSGRPVLYTPNRVGRNFSTFRQFKFRTMVKDAHAQLPQLVQRNVARGMIKIPNDPRVTRVGKWLRRYSLDELPQLYNVIRGEMSLVGSRPYAADEVSEDSPIDREILTMRPGLTGIWQVSARSDPSIDKRLERDLVYVRQFSLLVDLRIILKTVPAIFAGRGSDVTIVTNR